MAEENAAAGNGAQKPNRQVLLQKIYVKDASIEVPQAPQIFATNVQPQIDVNVGTQMKPMKDDLFDVVLTVTVTAKTGDDTAFLVEVQQAGIFLVRGFDNPQEKGAILGGYCPSMLFAFAREAVCDFVQKAGFPQLLLQPINFEALYLEHLARQRAESKSVITDPSAAPATH
ncbi:protein-export chaperone SecB [Panacagrimonas sp.]|uniref:protein-export chaperone SecB n=1 Tax=Panacagrimonas sp. TaxID=2480088 RepID=UPI003B52266D